MSLENWENVCQLLTNGVLGVKRACGHNVSFIMKPRMNLIMKRHSFRVETHRGKYKVNKAVPDSVKRTKCLLFVAAPLRSDREFPRECLLGHR